MHAKRFAVRGIIVKKENFWKHLAYFKQKNSSRPFDQFVHIAKREIDSRPYMNTYRSSYQIGLIVFSCVICKNSLFVENVFGSTICEHCPRGAWGRCRITPPTPCPG